MFIKENIFSQDVHYEIIYIFFLKRQNDKYEVKTYEVSLVKLI